MFNIFNASQAMFTGGIAFSSLLFIAIEFIPTKIRDIVTSDPHILPLLAAAKLMPGWTSIVEKSIDKNYISKYSTYIPILNFIIFLTFSSLLLIILFWVTLINVLFYAALFLQFACISILASIIIYVGFILPYRISKKTIDMHFIMKYFGYAFGIVGLVIGSVICILGIIYTGTFTDKLQIIGIGLALIGIEYTVLLDTMRNS